MASEVFWKAVVFRGQREGSSVPHSRRSRVTGERPVCGTELPFTPVATNVWAKAGSCRSRHMRTQPGLSSEADIPQGSSR